jgi:hypothetical protein
MSDSAEVVVRAFVAAINRQDVEGLAGLMAPEPKKQPQILRLRGSPLRMTRDG